jgi:ADP-ribose pyrophosphatase
MDRDDVDIIARDRVYDGYSKLEAYRLKHRRFNGGWTETLSRELLARGNAVCVLPYDPVRDEVVLVEQFRIGAYAAGLPPWQMEIVAGVVENGETEEDVARRELVEECGCTATGLHFVCRGLSSSGILSEVASVYCAIVDASAAGGIHGVPGEGEDIRATAYGFDAAMKLVEDGAFMHIQGIVALQWLAANRGRLQNTVQGEFS